MKVRYEQDDCYEKSPPHYWDGTPLRLGRVANHITAWAERE